MTTKNGISEMNLVQKIAAASEEMGAISKEPKKDSQLTYGYQSIDDMINRLNSVLAKYGLITYISDIPVSNTKDVSVSTKWGEKAGVRAEVTIILCITDGVSSIFAREDAIKIDYSDKSVTQAISMAFKYAHLRVFKVKTANDLDPDEYYTDHQDIKTTAVKTKPAGKPAQKTITEEGEGFLKALVTLADTEQFRTNVPKDIQLQVFNVWRIAEHGEKYLKEWLETNKFIYHIDVKF
jgi:hypothetical protein